MKTIAIIEKGTDDRYSVYLPDFGWVHGTGATEEEAKEDLQDAINEGIDYCEEKGIDAEGLTRDMDFEYRYDLSGFFVTYDIFNVSSLAREIGICPSLLRKYKTGKEYISVEQKTRVVEGIKRVAKEISAARF